MTVGQRALLVWIWMLVALIFLIVFLDGGLDREPLIFFVLLWTFDTFALVVVALRCMRYYARAGALSGGANDATTQFAADMPKLDARQALHAAAMLVAKALFEAVLCATGRRQIALDILIVMAPLWVFLSLLIGELATKVVEIHRKLL